MTDSEFVQRSDVGSPKALNSGAYETPESEYGCRLKGREEQLVTIRALHRRLWTYLMVTAIAGLVVAYVTFSSRLIPSFWTMLPVATAVYILEALSKNARAHSTVQRVAKFYELGVARLSQKWKGLGIDGREFLPADHVYASDLELFGSGSLFELLCTARTGIGRATLANWLLAPAESGEVIERQSAVAELRDDLDLREEWASAGRGGLDQVGSSGVRDWAEAPAVMFPFLGRAFAIVLPICLVVSSILHYAGVLGLSWRYAIAVLAGLELLLAVSLLKKSRFIAPNLVLPSVELGLLAPLLERIETKSFQCPLLKSLQLQLTSSSVRPAKQIRKLGAFVWLLNLRQSEYFALLGALLLWGTNVAIQVERWRQRNGKRLADWLESLGQFEALLCLARYHYENPKHTFPILNSHSNPFFHAEALGHPLLDSSTCVRSDLRLEAQMTQLIMVSGSNMSGKSTLLRSVGINAVLAAAGAPVCATRLEISPMQIGCSISVHDSLLQGKSRFQAEVERLKLILDLSRSGNLLFLLDEVLGGTNSRDRYLGARGVIEQLIGNTALGLVTTHDLALTEIVKALDGKAINVHFEEHYEDGEMRFDYTMRSGALTRSNGLNVMKALGILPESRATESNVTMPRSRPNID
jgi:MutS-like protein